MGTRTFAKVAPMLSGAVAVANGNTESKTGYATVHGLKMYAVPSKANWRFQ